MSINIPDPKAEKKADDIIPEATGEYIPNPHPGKELLTRFEAMDIINFLSAALMADERHRGG
jgi:hypothetical protein